MFHFDDSLLVLLFCERCYSLMLGDVAQSATSGYWGSDQLSPQAYFSISQYIPFTPAPSTVYTGRGQLRSIQGKRRHSDVHMRTRRAHILITV